MNGMLRLIWTYLYRCRESVSASTSKLEVLLKHFFPAGRLGIFPADDHLECLVYIVHFILSRFFEYGRELTLSLLQEQSIRSLPPSVNLTQHLAPERSTIALEAILRSLYLVEKEESTPSWPSNSDFSTPPSKDDYPTLSTFCPPSFMTKPGMQEYFDRCGAIVAAIASSCAKSVGRMSVFDDQWSATKLNGAYEEASSYVIRHHTDLAISVAFPSSLFGQIGMLQTCFSSWPRCLHPSLAMEDAIDMLIRGLIHVEPAVGEAAAAVIQRIIQEPKNLPTVLGRFASFLFSPSQIVSESFSGTHLAIESNRMLSAWLGVVDEWARDVMASPDSLEAPGTSWITAHFIELETAALFLLSGYSPTARRLAAKLLRTLSGITTHFHDQPVSPLDGLGQDALHILNVFLVKQESATYFDNLEELVESIHLSRLTYWRQSSAPESFIRLAESDDEKDQVIWRLVYPKIIGTRIDAQSKVLGACRDIWIAAAKRYHPHIVAIAGLTNARPQLPHPSNRTIGPAANLREREKVIVENVALISQWHLWVKLICCTAHSPEPKPATGTFQREHSRAPSDLGSPERDLLSSSSRGLFRYLIPFLDADASVFREIAVLCISSFPTEAYHDLLEDLSAYSARHFLVDSTRAKMSPTSGGRRNRRHDRLYLAVAHIYQLTACYLKVQRGMDRQDSLTNVLKFVRHTQSFLSAPEMRNDWQQQRLRRYFCGIVEQLFDGLNALQATDRFIPTNMHLTLYRLCEEWCQCGNQSDRVRQRLVAMQMAATAGFAEPSQKAGAIERFQTETKLLSNAAAGAMASLCVSLQTVCEAAL